MFLRNLEVFYAYICMESLMTINNQYFEIVAFIYVYLISMNEIKPKKRGIELKIFKEIAFSYS